MSTTARKARKRAGIQFTKPQKTPTPLEQRSFLERPMRQQGDAIPAGFTSILAPRSPKRVAAFLASGGREHVYPRTTA